MTKKIKAYLVISEDHELWEIFGHDDPDGDETDALVNDMRTRILPGKQEVLVYPIEIDIPQPITAKVE